MGAVFGLLAAIGIGMSDLYGRRVVLAAGAVTAALALQVVGVVVALGLATVLPGAPTAVDLAWGAGSGAGMAVGLGCYYAGLARSSTTIVSPLVATLSAVIPFAWAVLRGSGVALVAIVGAAVAVVGLAVIAGGAIDRVGLKSGVLWGTISGCGYGSGFAVLVEAADDAGVWPAVSQRAVGALVLSVAALVVGQRLVPPTGQRINGLAAGVFAGLTSVFALIGIQLDAPTAVLTTSTFPAMSVVVGVVAFGDRASRRQVVGIALVIVGVAGTVSA